MCNLNTLPRLECVAIVRDNAGNLHRARGKYASFCDMWEALAARGLTIVSYKTIGKEA